MNLKAISQATGPHSFSDHGRPREFLLKNSDRVREKQFRKEENVRMKIFESFLMKSGLQKTAALIIVAAPTAAIVTNSVLPARASRALPTGTLPETPDDPALLG